MNKLFNNKGKLITPNKVELTESNSLNKKAFGLYSSIFEYPNQGKFRNIFYVNQDSELASSMYTRDLLCRWSRQVTARQPMIKSAIRAMAMFIVGKEYNPYYTGKNKAWGDIIIKYLKEEVLPTACKRGKNYSFQQAQFLKFTIMAVDGDLLEVYGEENELAKFQIIPSHRISSMTCKNSQDTVLPTPNTDVPTVGPFPNTIVSDGVVYNPQGAPLGYNVINPSNLVNSLLGNQENLFFSINNSRLLYDPEYFDRGRGMPFISNGIIQALSLGEIQDYLIEKIKVESMVALVEKTISGEGPQEEANALAQLMQDNANLGTNPNNLQGANTGLRIVESGGIKYVSANGGDVKSLSSSTPGMETSEYLTRLESHVLQSIGIPHALLFSMDKVSGRISDGVVENFNATVEYYQRLLDVNAKFFIAVAVAKGIKNGHIPANDEENLNEVFEMTHPPKLSLNRSYERNDNMNYYKAGLQTLRDTIDIPVDEFFAQLEAEKISFFHMANTISKETNTDISTVIQSLREDMNQKDAADVMVATDMSNGLSATDEK